MSDTLDENFPTHYTASIADLNNSLTAYTNTPFTKQDREGNYRILELKATGQTLYILDEPTTGLYIISLFVLFL